MCSCTVFPAVVWATERVRLAKVHSFTDDTLDEWVRLKIGVITLCTERHSLVFTITDYVLQIIHIV